MFLLMGLFSPCERLLLLDIRHAGYQIDWITHHLSGIDGPLKVLILS